MTEDDFLARVTAEMACPDCPAEVRVTFGAQVYARVIHTDTCPWLPRYQARELSQRNGDNVGAIPCGVRGVTHRGPYKRDPEQEEAAVIPAAPVRLVPRGPDRAPKPCHVPGCGEPARLYPAGWLCDEHKPGARPAASGGAA